MSDHSHIKPNFASFAKQISCYNTRTATDILVRHKCQLYSAKKIRVMIGEFMSNGLNNSPDNSPANDSSNVQYITAISLLEQLYNLKSYARTCGGMAICALAQYLTVEQWYEHLELLESKQSEQLLWIEPFIRGCITLKDDEFPQEKIDWFIESIAEKIPVSLLCMYDEPVEITYID